MSTPTTQELATQLNASFSALCKTFAHLQPEEIDNGCMANGWSPRALLAHIAFWDEAQTGRMKALILGEPLPQNIRQAWQANDERAMADNNRPWQEILAVAEAARQSMVEFVGSLNDESFSHEYSEGERTISASQLFQHMLRHTNEHRRELGDYCGSLQRWTRPALRRFVVQQYTTLMDSIGGLNEATILATQVCGIWSMRDVLAHVLCWNEFEYKTLKHWPHPKPELLEEWMYLENENTDTVNARLLAARSDLDMIAIVDWLTTYHRKVLKIFDKASDEMLASQADVGWGHPLSMTAFIYDMAMHDLEHAEDIWRWKAER